MDGIIKAPHIVLTDESFVKKFYLLNNFQSNVKKVKMFLFV